MGCASGMPKTEESLKVWKLDEKVVQAAKAKCTGVFSGASGGTIDALWNNKRTILREARECARAATTLAEQAENRNLVAGE